MRPYWPKRANLAQNFLYFSCFLVLRIYSLFSRIIPVSIFSNGTRFTHYCSFRSVLYVFRKPFENNTADSRYLEFQGTLLKCFEISVPRHIRIAELRKK